MSSNSDSEAFLLWLTSLQLMTNGMLNMKLIRGPHLVAIWWIPCNYFYHHEELEGLWVMSFHAGQIGWYIRLLGLFSVYLWASWFDRGVALRDEIDYLLGHEEELEDFANDVPLSVSYSYDPVTQFLNYIDNGNFSVNGVLADVPLILHQRL
ncbi:hypothetical protein CMV_027161 [Castanea mollissima]|uniref:Uncharacterized protein n=1 Tax=Castanea mollissima TaxID=60419 RepID=A0A8J4QIL0_9ROSI|nr:hypothetical protein CMV_027161 [Castanea mollissima]